MKKRLVIALLILLVLVAATAAVLYFWLRSYANTPAHGSGSVVAVDIPSGTGPRQVAKLLHEKGVVEDPDRFYYYLRYGRRVAGQLKAGELAFRDNMTPEEVTEVLLNGTPITHRVTIPEGLRIDEIGELFEKEGLADAKVFEARARDRTLARKLGVPADSLEGFLSPETYQFRKHTPTDEILRVMVDQYRRVFTEAYRKQAQENMMTELQAVTLASIIEKETGAPQERPLIGGLFHNRLKKNWLLQTDPTVIYAVILARGRFNGDITKADLQIDHPYNTYRYKGLPPGPICNPGSASIQAALFPDSTDAMFFVSKNDGTHVFCPNLACHNRAVARYQRSQ